MQVNPIIEEEQLLWISGQDNIGVYRIPLLTYTPKGHLLAICEARKNGGGDAGPKFLATRRSEDKGIIYVIISTPYKTTFDNTKLKCIKY